MKFSPLILPILTAGALALCSARAAQPPASSAMHLSGRLTQAGAPAAGEHEFRFELFTTDTGATRVPLTQMLVTTEMVAAGSWQTALDLRRFGGELSILDNTVVPADLAVSILDNTVIPGVGSRAILDNTVRTATQQSWRAIEGNWLQISVRRRGDATFTPLSPRQRLASVPRAATAFTAEHAVVAGSIALGGVDAQALAPATVVRSINGLQDAVTLAAGTGVSLNTAGNTITINATATGGGTPLPDGNYIAVNAENSLGDFVSGSVIGGGYRNSGVILPQTQFANSITIAGGSENTATGSAATVGGGHLNSALNGGTVAGGSNNRAGFSSSVAGGTLNSGDGSSSAIGGGFGNSALSSQSVIAGGNGNRVDGSTQGAIGGGLENTMTGSTASVIGGGGQNNILNAPFATITGGAGNFAGTDRSAIIGGGNNRTEGNGSYATVLGGSANIASGTHSIAAGHRAHATHSGSFVWNAWPGNPFASLRDYEFAIHAPGGVRLQTDGAGLFVDGQRFTPGAAASSSLTVAQGTAFTATSEDLQAGVGVEANGRVALRATSASPQGAAIQAIQLNGSGYAGDFAGKVKISSTLEANGGVRLAGNLRVNGLGDNTPTAAFRLVPELLTIFTATYPGSFSTLYAIIDHPALNGNPNALLMLTPVNREAYKLCQRTSDVLRGDFLIYYPDAPESPAAMRGRWVIDITPTPGGPPVNASMAVFNAMVVIP